MRRDPRGFASKFRSEGEIWDIARENTRVFFIQDGFSFRIVSILKNAAHSLTWKMQMQSPNLWIRFEELSSSNESIVVYLDLSVHAQTFVRGVLLSFFLTSMKTEHP